MERGAGAGGEPADVGVARRVTEPAAEPQARGQGVRDVVEEADAGVAPGRRHVGNLHGRRHWQARAGGPAAPGGAAGADVLAGLDTGGAGGGVLATAIQVGARAEPGSEAVGARPAA